MGHIRNYSEEIASEIDNEVHMIISNAYANTEKKLLEHVDKLHKVAAYLFTNEKMDAETFVSIMQQSSDASLPEEAQEEPQNETPSEE